MTSEATPPTIWPGTPAGDYTHRVPRHPDDDSLRAPEPGASPRRDPHARHPIPEVELIGNNDAAMGAPLASVSLGFTREIRHVERHEGALASDGEVELLTVGCLTVPGLVRAEGVEAAVSEDPSDDGMDVRVEVDRERQSAAVPREAASGLAPYIEITGSSPHHGFTVLPDGPIDHAAVVVVERERVVDVRQRQVGPRFDDLLRSQPKAIHIDHHGTDGKTRPNDHGLATADARPPFHVWVIAPTGRRRRNPPGPGRHANTLSDPGARSPARPYGRTAAARAEAGDTMSAADQPAHRPIRERGARGNRRRVDASVLKLEERESRRPAPERGGRFDAR
jgi:hypothetical protein